MDAPPDNVRGWLVAILRNNWLNLLRHRRVRARAMPELIHGTPDDWRLHETRALRFQFERAWEELPAQARAIAVQCLIDGEPHEDVSARFGMTPGGVATSIHRTRASLRQSMFDGAR
jgi:RNA polymerase sigma factor (sigma-70 family)